MKFGKQIDSTAKPLAEKACIACDRIQPIAALDAAMLVDGEWIPARLNTCKTCRDRERLKARRATA